MGEKTNISWTDSTWNPWWGCNKVSAGCDYCYAEVLSFRFGKEIWGPPRRTPRRTFGDKHWEEPLIWNRKCENDGVRRKVFCGSMMDWAEWHPDTHSERKKLWPLIRETPWLDWQLLTKRPERIPQCLPDDWGSGYDNVWLMTSIEDERVVHRVKSLLEIPARVHGLSIEPLIGPVSIKQWIWGIEWVIIGGESIQRGHYRPMKLEWAENIIEECHSKVPVFVKQLGTGWARFHKAKDKKGEDDSEWPEHLKIKQFPELT